MKKNLIATVALTALCFAALPSSAQLGKSLKDMGKSVTSAATSAATDATTDIAAGKVADKISAWMDSNNRVVAADSPYAERLANVTAGMTADGVALNFKAYESAEANILACANGSVRVYTAMMDMLTDDELYAVIAEQVGHIVNKDVKNNMMKVATAGNANSAAAAQLNKILSMSGDNLGTIVNELIQIPYTDAQNQAADKYASSMLKTAGKNVSALASALNKFAEMESNDAKAKDDANVQLSAASKYVKVNPNNAVRAGLVK